MTRLYIPLRHIFLATLFASSLVWILTQDKNVSKTRLKSKVPVGESVQKSSQPLARYRRLAWLWGAGDNEYEEADEEEVSGSEEMSGLILRDDVGSVAGGGNMEQRQCDDIFTCRNGTTICYDQVCDGKVDCGPNEDEYLCSCSAGQTKCDEATCLEVWQLCDGVPDCGDKTDEENCTTTAPTTLITSTPLSTTDATTPNSITGTTTTVHTPTTPASHNPSETPQSTTDSISHNPSETSPSTTNSNSHNSSVTPPISIITTPGATTVTQTTAGPTSTAKTQDSTTDTSSITTTTSYTTTDDSSTLIPTTITTPAPASTTSKPQKLTCRTDDSLMLCNDTVTYACKCDDVKECPDEDDEIDCGSGKGTFCLVRLSLNDDRSWLNDDRQTIV